MFEAETPEASQKRVEEFRALFKTFRAGARWLGAQIAGWTGAREHMPRIAGDIKEFREKVEGPLDRLWDQMNEDERKQACDAIGI